MTQNCPPLSKNKAVIRVMNVAVRYGDILFRGRFVQGFIVMSTYPNWPPSLNRTDEIAFEEFEDLDGLDFNTGRSAFVSIQPSGLIDIRVKFHFK